jgi:hypothetical protein
VDWETTVELLNVVIWPLVVGIALFLYRKPLSKLLAGLGRRVTKLSAFEISIELAALPAPPSPWFDLNIPQSSEMRGGEVSSTALMELFTHIGAEEPWDYLIVDIKDGRFWFVSRLFIFTVFLQAMRGLKCVVFVQTSGENRRRLLGLASPEAVRTALGQAFPWLERALENALNKHLPSFLAPALPPDAAGEIIRTFIEERDMRLYCDPEELLKPGSNCQISEYQRPTDPVKPNEWRRLGDMDIWEHTHWLDLGIRQVSEAVTKSFYERDSSHYVESSDVPAEERIRALLFCKAPYIAVVNSRGELKTLLDRQKLAALVGETLIKE